MSAPKRIKLDDEERLHPVLPDDLIEETPLLDVYVDEISDPKHISKVIIELNSVLPIPDLNHLKRVRKRDILLFPTSECSRNDVHKVLQEKNFHVGYLANKVRVVSVAKVAPQVRKQYVNVNKLWPCNFHSDKYLEKLSTNTLFSESEIEKHERYMRLCLQISEFLQKNYSLKTCNAAVIIDPKIDSLVAVGYDNLKDGPCQHAMMLSIDNVAKTQDGGIWRSSSKIETTVESESESDGITTKASQYNLNGIPSDMLTFLKANFSDLNFGSSIYKNKSELEVPSDGPYLCTGYYAYTLKEPCIMCAMALVHSRIKRTYYGIPTKKGGLGTLCKVHTVKELNHHFEVFAGVLKEECLLRLN